MILAAILVLTARDESGQPIAARFEVHGAGGKVYQAEGSLLSRPPGRPDTGSPYLRSFVVKGTATLDVPPGRYRVVAEHGLEYERVTREVNAPGRVELTLKPWVRMREKGWWSGDMHVHRPMADTPLLLEAEDLNFGVVFTMWNRQNIWGAQPLPSEWIRKAGEHRWRTVTNAEDERGGGAWMLHGLKSPLGLEHVVPAGQPVTESWNPPGIEFVRKARAQKQGLFPWFDLEKPIWWEAPVMMALERPDSMGLLNNHYDQYGMYDNEAWARKRDTARFPSFSDYSLHLMYRYWNLGWLVPPSAGAASGVLPNPVGYNRMYVKLDGDFSVEKWYEGVKAGRVMVSNGPILFFDPKGRIEAISRDDLERVEIVGNGQVIQSWKPRGKRFRANFEVDPTQYSWIAARCFAKNDLTVRLAHTGPFQLNGKWDARDDARYFREWLQELPSRPLYEEAIKVYRELEK